MAWKLVALVFVVALVWGCASFRPTSPVCLAGAHLDAYGRCQVQQAPGHHIPFRAGHKVKVMQGFHGYVSHKEDLAFSVDFGCELGTPIVASRRAVVWAVRKDSNSGCADQSCVDQANYVILDHGDGSYSEYYHLLHHGVTVKEGEHVCAGQVIGLCGNTGFSSGPHLHFAVSDAARHTIPVQFQELGRDNFGYVVPDTAYTSQNERQVHCGKTRYSDLSRDAFVHQGVLLRDAIPGVIVKDRRTMTIAGTYYGDHTHVAVHRKPASSGRWVEHCVPVDPKGRFLVTINWPQASFPNGFYWLMITGSDKNCASPGWAWSYKVRVDGDQNQTPKVR
ncbi:MAG: M23 family metallopeptidase [Bradymonadaceae bacterium]|nr:M23 family metallopeptidase [Lujinxingiaceae bacterium]